MLRIKCVKPCLTFPVPPSPTSTSLKVGGAFAASAMLKAIIHSTDASSIGTVRSRICDRISQNVVEGQKLIKKVDGKGSKNFIERLAWVR